MSVHDRWTNRDGTPSTRAGQGMRWHVIWRDHGRQKSQSFRTKSEADRFWVRVQSGGLAPAPAEILIDTLADQLRAAKSDLAAKTVEWYDGGLRHVMAEFSGRRAASIQPSEIRLWLAALKVRHGPQKDPVYVPASASSKQQSLHVLSSLYQLAIDDGMFGDNPCEKITVSRHDKREPRFLMFDQLERLAWEAGRIYVVDGIDYQTMTLFMGTAAPRIGEVAALRIGNIDLSRGRGRIYRSRGSTGEGRTKTRRSRDVPLPPPVQERLEKLIKGRDPQDYLFRSPTGCAVNVGNWRSRVFYPAAKKAGLAGIRPHDLRHTAASLAIGSGADLKAVQEMMGHRTATMTWDTYGHLWPGRIDDVGVRMGLMFGEGKPSLVVQQGATQSTSGQQDPGRDGPADGEMLSESATT